MREELPRKGMEVHPPEERGIGLKRLRGGSGEGFSTFKAFLRLLCGAFLELERFSNIQRPFLPQGRAGSRGVQLSIYSLLSPVPAVFSRASARPLQARKPAAIAPSVFGATLPAHSLDLFRACPSFAAARFHKPAAYPAKFAFCALSAFQPPVLSTQKRVPLSAGPCPMRKAERALFIPAWLLRLFVFS